jgi:hypothetical protein
LCKADAKDSSARGVQRGRLGYNRGRRTCLGEGQAGCGLVQPACANLDRRPHVSRSKGLEGLAQSASAGRAVGCRSAVVPCGVGGPRRRRWAPEHVLQGEFASALSFQERADIRECVVRVLPGIVLLQSFEALHHGQAQELERIEGATCGATSGQPGLHQIELPIRREQRVQTHIPHPLV